MRFFWTTLLLLLIALLTSSSTHAEERVALVVGNSAYRDASTLPNTRNDATDIAAALQRLGFSVSPLLDGTFDGMRRALLQFSRDVRGADMAVFYFAGHGMEIGGENWLIPVDAELRSADKLALPGRPSECARKAPRRRGETLAQPASGSCG